MILAFLFIGILMIVSGLKGTQHELGDQLGHDITGAGGFIYWFGAILSIGALGLIPGLRRPSHWLLALILVVIVLHNGGFVSNLVNAIQGTADAGPAPSQPLPAFSLGGSSGGGGNVAGDLFSGIGAIGGLF